MCWSYLQDKRENLLPWLHAALLVSASRIFTRQRAKFIQFFLNGVIENTDQTMVGVNQPEMLTITWLKGKTLSFASPKVLVPWLRTTTQVLKEKPPLGGDPSMIKRRKNKTLDQSACRRVDQWIVTKQRPQENHIIDDYNLVLLTQPTSSCYS